MKSRDKSFELLNSEFDLLIVGGGITGAGIVRDATLRGLKCLLIDKNDFSSGTSSKSGKLIHGGLRYLRYLHLKVVHDACMERYYLLNTIAPHIVKPLKFILPFYKQSHTPKWTGILALILYGVLALFRNVHRFRIIKKNELKLKEPLLKNKDSNGALSYYDCMVNDARLVIDTLKSVTETNSIILNYCRIIKINHQQESKQVFLIDTLTGKEIQTRAKVLVNATGIWADDFIEEFNFQKKFNIKTNTGIHIIVNRERLKIEHAIILESIDDYRSFYCVPMDKFVLVGTTDVEYNGNKDNIPINNDSISYLLKSLNYYFPEAEIDKKDIVNYYIGARPLILKEQEKKVKEIKRDYLIITDEKGLVSISGGKLTTYRLMAEKIVNQIIYNFFPNKKKISCSTISPISGASKMNEIIKNIPEKFHFLIDRYGSNTVKIMEDLQIISENEHSIGKLPFIWGEIKYIVENEFVETLEDLFLRRTQIWLLYKNDLLDNLESIAKFVGKIKKWNLTQVNSEVNHMQKLIML